MNPAMLRVWSVLLAMVLSLIAPASAQIVNVLDRVSGPESGVNGSLRASLEWRTGNPDLLQGGLSGEACRARPSHLLFLIATGEVGKKDGQRYLAKHFEHLRLRRPVSSAVAIEAFGQVAHDEFRRLSVRALGGAGVRLRVAGGDAGFVAVGTSYMAEHEEISGSDTEAAETIFSHRNSSYLHTAFTPRKDIALGATVFVQPVIDELDDVRSLVDMYLRIGAGAVFLQNSFHLEYDSRSPSDVDELQTTFKSSIGFRFESTSGS